VMRGTSNWVYSAQSEMYRSWVEKHILSPRAKHKCPVLQAPLRCNGPMHRSQLCALVSCGETCARFAHVFLGRFGGLRSVVAVWFGGPRSVVAVSLALADATERVPPLGWSPCRSQYSKHTRATLRRGRGWRVILEGHAPSWPCTKRLRTRPQRIPQFDSAVCGFGVTARILPPPGLCARFPPGSAAEMWRCAGPRRECPAGLAPDT